MIYLEFPIMGQLRFILMIFEWIFSILCLEFGILFMYRHKKEKFKFKYSQDIGYILLFFTLSLSGFFSVLGSYFLHNIFAISLYHFISYFLLNIGFLLFIIVKEKKRVYLFKKYFFSVSLSLLLITFIYFSFLNYALIIIQSLIFLSFTYLFFLIFFIEFIKKTKIESQLLIKIIITFLALLLLLIGLFLTSDYSLYLVQINFRLFGSLLQLCGVILFAIFFIKFPIFSEFNWKGKIEEVFLIYENGACLFYKSYIRKLDLLNKHLITSAITSVNFLIKEILKSGSKEISIIRKKGKIINIFPGDSITGVVFSNEESKTIELYMRQFIMKIEQIYKNILKNWDGDLEIFKPTKDIFEDIFSA